MRVVEQADAERFEVAPGTVHISYLELGDGGGAPEIVALVFEATQHALEFLRVEV